MRVLLTGVASLIGAEVLRSLLVRADVASVLLLVPQDARAAADIQERLRSYLGPLPDSVTTIGGDPRLPRFGLSPKCWEEMAWSIDAGVNCAQRETQDQRFDQARQANVRPLDGWIQLLGRNPKLRLHHLSTAAIGGTRRGLLTEFDLDCGQGFHNAWERSKFEAEMRLRESRVSERVTIHRPAHILGHSKSGEAFQMSGAYPLIATLAAASFVPADSKARFDLVPVDYVAAAMTSLICAEAEGTFHLACGWHRSLPISQLASIVSNASGGLRSAHFLPRGVAGWLGIAGIGATGSVMGRRLAYSTARDQLQQTAVLDTYRTERYLNRAQPPCERISCPIPETWLGGVIEAAAARRWAQLVDEFERPLEQASIPSAAAEFSLARKNAVYVEKKFQRIGDVDVAYRDIGQGEPVVFLHGFAGAHSWDGVVQRIASIRRAIVVETLGLGDSKGSAAEDFYLAAQAAQVRGLLSTLEIPAAHIVGNGLGGTIALIFAVRWPQCAKSLVLSNCKAEGVLPMSRSLAKLISLPLGVQTFSLLLSVPAFVRSRFGFGGLVYDKRLQTKERLAIYREVLAGSTERRNRISKFLRAAKGTSLTNLDHQIRDLDIPAIIVWGAEDEYISSSWAKELFEAIPGARRLELIPFAGHSCHEEQPDIFARSISEFLAELTEVDSDPVLHTDSAPVPVAAYQSNGTSALTSRV